MNNLIDKAVNQQELDLSRFNSAKSLIKAGFLIMTELYDSFDYSKPSIPLYDQILDFIEVDILPSDFFWDCECYKQIITEEG